MPSEPVTVMPLLKRDLEDGDYGERHKQQAQYAGYCPAADESMLLKGVLGTVTYNEYILTVVFANVVGSDTWQPRRVTTNALDTLSRRAESRASTPLTLAFEILP